MLGFEVAKNSGSPAPAGIDRERVAYSGASTRFPRASGDRPWLNLGAGIVNVVPPAPAGIDPEPDHRTAARPGFPRASGDRPVADGHNRVAVWVPPRQRG